MKLGAGVMLLALLLVAVVNGIAVAQDPPPQPGDRKSVV